jgi:transposase
VLVTAGQAGDNPALLGVLNDITVPARSAGRARRWRPERVIADKAYSHPSTRQALRHKGIKATIPERSDQVAHRKAKGRAGGRPPAFDPAVYRGRNVVERAFNRLKQWRAIATRYDKHARNYRAGIVLASILLWLR